MFCTKRKSIIEATVVSLVLLFTLGLLRVLVWPSPSLSTVAYESSKAIEGAVFRLSSVHRMKNGHREGGDEVSSSTVANPTPTLSPYERLATQVPPPPGFNATGDTFDIPDNIHYDSAGPRPDQFVVLTAADGGGHNDAIPSAVENALQNRQEYCDHRGYICHWVDLSRIDMNGAHPVWKTLPAIIETFQTYPDVQWLWKLDLDAIIMSPEYDITKQLLSRKGLEQHLLKNETIKGTPHVTPSEIDPGNIDILMAQDPWSLNAGSFLVRRSEFSRWLLDTWKDPVLVEKGGFKGREQSAIIHLVKTHPTVRTHFGIVPLRIIQSWAQGSEQYGWHEGDVAVHFAGCWVKGHCKQDWDKFWAMKKIAPPPKKKGWAVWMG